MIFSELEFIHVLTFLFSIVILTLLKCTPDPEKYGEFAYQMMFGVETTFFFSWPKRKLQFEFDDYPIDVRGARSIC